MHEMDYFHLSSRRANITFNSLSYSIACTRRLGYIIAMFTRMTKRWFERRTKCATSITSGLQLLLMNAAILAPKRHSFDPLWAGATAVSPRGVWGKLNYAHDVSHGRAEKKYRGYSLIRTGLLKTALRAAAIRDIIFFNTPTLTCYEREPWNSA